MGTVAPLHRTGRDLGTRALSFASLLALAVLLGAGVAAAFYHSPPPVALLTVGVVGTLAVVALALARYDLAVAVGLLLMAVVRFEPAPVDGLFAVVIAVALVTGRFDIARVPLVITATVGFILILNVVSAMEAVDPSRAAVFFSITLYLSVFALWFTGYLRSARQARTVVIAYVAGAVGSALLGTLAVTVGLGSASFTAYDGARAVALFKDPNVFGPFLVPAALIVLEESLRGRLLKGWPIVKWLVFLILVVGILFSYSRAAWLNIVVATVVTLVVLTIRRRSGRGALGMLLVILVAGLVVAAAVSFTQSASFLQERAQRQAYDGERFAAQRRGVQLGLEHPVGIGPGQFELRSPISSHSTYVRALAEQGVLGFSAIVFLFLATFVFAVRNAVRGRDTYGIGSAALLGVWCGMLANSLVVDTVHWRHLWFVAALIWAGAAGADSRASRSASNL
jgi:O-antigen ligase